MPIKNIGTTSATLKERRAALYNFLLQRGDKWTPQEMATDAINLYPAFFTSDYHSSYARRLLTNDIQAINADPSYEKIIISASGGIKLANAEEANRFINAELCETFRKLKRTRFLLKKMKLDGQINLEGQVREAFVDGE